MKYLPSIVAIAVALGPIKVTAQETSNCYWIGNVWTCNTQGSQSGGIDWSIATGGGNSFNQSLQQGMAIGERARRARQERERHEAQMELYRAQAEAGKSQSGSQQPGQQEIPEHIRLWLRKAEPRMNLFPDFAEKVYAEDVAFTPGMVMLMSGSDYAADIAYHLATHQTQARAIAQLHLLDAARAIVRIENEVIAGLAQEE